MVNEENQSSGKPTKSIVLVSIPYLNLTSSTNMFKDAWDYSAARLHHFGSLLNNCNRF